MRSEDLSRLVVTPDDSRRVAITRFCGRQLYGSLNNVTETGVGFLDATPPYAGVS